MKRLIILGLFAMPGCAPSVVTNIIQLTPANQTALQDGTPIVRLTGYAGNPRATVSFVFANGDTLSGDAIMNGDVQNGIKIWGQAGQILSQRSTVQMVAIDDRQTMDCSGIFNPQATNLTCDFSDGAIYREDYTAPPPQQPPTVQGLGSVRRH